MIVERGRGGGKEEEKQGVKGGWEGMEVVGGGEGRRE